MKLNRIPTIKSLSNPPGSTHDLTVRRARHVWRDRNGKALLVAFFKHPEALLYTHKRNLADHPNIYDKVLPEFRAWLEEQGYTDMRLAVLRNGRDQLEKLAVTPHWKLNDRTTVRVATVALPAGPEPYRGSEPCRGPEVKS